jgi:hypothetical protein
MEFWNEAVTVKSWDLLLKIRQLPIRFVLIGGWAAYLWARLHKSKDIDIVVSGFDDLEYLKKNYDLRKNEHLNTYEIIVDEIDVDIYVPHFSKLALPAEEIIAQAVKVENIEAVRPEALLILKQGAELDRRDSVKGKKDRIDIMALIIKVDMDWALYFRLLEKHNLSNYFPRLKEIIAEFKDIKYLDLNPREFKLKKAEVLERLRKAR